MVYDNNFKTAVVMYFTGLNCLTFFKCEKIICGEFKEYCLVVDVRKKVRNTKHSK